jgi:hypothetical protein
MSKIKNKIQEAIVAMKKMAHEMSLKTKYQPISTREILCNSRGNILDIALGLLISVVVAVIILAALKSLFNINILPSVTSNITGMFS